MKVIFFWDASLGCDQLMKKEVKCEKERLGLYWDYAWFGVFFQNVCAWKNAIWGHMISSHRAKSIPNTEYRSVLQIDLKISRDVGCGSGTAAIGATLWVPWGALLHLQWHFHTFLLQHWHCRTGEVTQCDCLLFWFQILFLMLHYCPHVFVLVFECACVQLLSVALCALTILFRGNVSEQYEHSLTISSTA